MKLNHKLALLLIVGTAGYVAFQNLDLLRGSAKDEDPALLFNRIWMESKPENATDYVHGAYFLSRPQLGIFQRSSAYDFHFERFDYKRDGAKMALTFPQEKRTTDVALHITKCSGAPAPFDLCLDLDENPWGGPKRYYGMTEQEDEARALGPSAAALRAHVPTE